MKWLLISDVEEAIYDEDELREIILPNLHRRCRIYRLNGVEKSPQEFYIREGYVESLWGNLEFNFRRNE